MKSVRRLVAVFAAVLAAAFTALLVTSTSASAAPSPCPVGDPGLGGCTATVSLSSTTVAQGGTDTASGTGMTPGSTVTGVGQSTPVTLFTTVADAAGNFSASFTVPAGFPAGAHTLTATDATGRSASTGFTVTASSSSSSSAPSSSSSSSSGTGSSGGGSSLATTGAAVIGIGSLAVILLVGGGAMLFVGRRRPSSNSHH